MSKNTGMEAEYYLKVRSELDPEVSVLSCVVVVAAHMINPSTQRQEFQDNIGGVGGDVSEKWPSLLVVLTRVPGEGLGAGSRMKRLEAWILAHTSVA